MQTLETMTSGQLVSQYNHAAQILGTNPVKKFSDKKTAVRRTTAILEDAKHVKPAAKREKKLWSNFLGMRQDIKPQDKQVQLKRPDSIRAEALEILERGANFGQLSELFDKHDKERGITGKDNLRRSYEMVRIFCHYYGYGTESSKDGTVIKLVTK